MKAIVSEMCITSADTQRLELPLQTTRGFVNHFRLIHDRVDNLEAIIPCPYDNSRNGSDESDNRISFDNQRIPCK